MTLHTIQLSVLKGSVKKVFCVRVFYFLHDKNEEPFVFDCLRLLWPSPWSSRPVWVEWWNSRGAALLLGRYSTLSPSAQSRRSPEGWWPGVRNTWRGQRAKNNRVQMRIKILSKPNCRPQRTGTFHWARPRKSFQSKLKNKLILIDFLIGCSQVFDKRMTIKQLLVK